MKILEKVFQNIDPDADRLRLGRAGGPLSSLDVSALGLGLARAEANDVALTNRQYSAAKRVF